MPTNEPRRVQLSRAKGWRKPENTVVVARPTMWGNPWRVAQAGRYADGAAAWAGRHEWEVNYPMTRCKHEAAARAVAEFRAWLEKAKERLAAPTLAEKIVADPKACAINSWVHTLRGHNLACWCPLDQPCHADVLLELANAPDRGEHGETL